MKFVAFDVETSGTDRAYALQPFRALTGKAWLTCAAFAYPVGELTPTAPHSGPLSVEDIREHLVFCAENNITITAWNTTFDVAWLIALGLREEVFACKWIDAMLLLKHLRQEPTFTGDRRGYGLKAAVAEYFPEESGYEDDVDFFTVEPSELQKLYKYNKKDAEFTLRLTTMFWKQLRGRRRHVQVEAECIPLIADTMVNGVSIDVGKATSLSAELEKRANTAYVELVLRNPEVTSSVLQSPTQLRALLYDTWGLTATKLTEKGEKSTDREALTDLAYDPRAALINDYRENTSNRTKFAEGAINSAKYNEDGKARPQFRIYGTYTGRGTYSANTGFGKNRVPTGIAIHQWKRDADFRSVIQAPPGWQIVEFDFAGQEFRWMAVAANDPTMLALCEPGQDAHQFMASRIYNIPKVQITKDQRQLGKVANLSLQYRTGPRRLSTLARTNYGLDLPESEAFAVHATYKTTYREVPKYWSRQCQWIQGHDYVENLVGRRTYIPFDQRIRDMDWAVTSTAVNFPIQSMGADQKYAALMLLRRMLPMFDGKLLFELHDGVYMMFPQPKAEKALHTIGRALNTLPYSKIFNIELPIQFPVDAKLGTTWGDLQEVDIV